MDTLTAINTNALTAFKSTVSLLTFHNIESPENEALYIFKYALGISDADMIVSNPSLDDDQLLKLESILKRRANREPIQYILGETEFYGLSIKVREGVLIPRPETELLVEAVIKSSDADTKAVLDLCCGSGAITLAIAKNLPNALVIGVDISGVAIECSETNKGLLSIENAEFVKGDLFTEVDGRSFDIIVSNPPYIKSNDIPNLQSEVRDWEPSLALDGGLDGLEFYKKIIHFASGHLKAEGLLALELGEGQCDSVKSFAVSEGFEVLYVLKDYAGIDRVLLLGRPE